MPHYRALPWANRHELAQLYAWIWDDPDDRESTERACARLSIYLQSPSSPLFIPILHSLLTALLLPYPSPTPHAHLTSRLTHGAALTRFINSLVDPLQQRAYARPIALIARELGLPEGLVAIRHAVTHEDLPALGVLRTAVMRAVEWLRTDVLGPVVWPADAQLSSSSSTTREGWQGEDEFKGAVGKYKKLIKAYYRQRTSARGVTSSAGWEGARALRMVMRQMEDLVRGGIVDIGRERVARRITRVFLAPQGGMVPSYRKRPQYDPHRADDFPAPTTPTRRIWTPLMTLLGDIFAALDDDDDDDDDDDEDNDNDDNDALIGWPEYFASECAAVIHETIAERADNQSMTPPPSPRADERQDQVEADYWVVPSDDETEPVVRKTPTAASEETTTYLASLAGWLVYALSETRPTRTTTKKRKRKAEDEDTAEGLLSVDEGARGRVVRELVQQAGMRAVRDAVRWYEAEQAEFSGPSMSHILSSLMRVDETCRQVIYDLAPPDRAIDEAVLGDASAVERIMEQRLQVFRKTMMTRAHIDSAATGESVEVDGWVKLGAASGWKECPMGYWRG